MLEWPELNVLLTKQWLNYLSERCKTAIILGQTNLLKKKKLTASVRLHSLKRDSEVPLIGQAHINRPTGNVNIPADQWTTTFWHTKRPSLMQIWCLSSTQYNKNNVSSSSARGHTGHRPARQSRSGRRRCGDPAWEVSAAPAAFYSTWSSDWSWRWDPCADSSGTDCGHTASTEPPPPPAAWTGNTWRSTTTKLEQLWHQSQGYKVIKSLFDLQDLALVALPCFSRMALEENLQLMWVTFGGDYKVSHFMKTRIWAITVNDTSRRSGTRPEMERRVFIMWTLTFPVTWWDPEGSLGAGEDVGTSGSYETYSGCCSVLQWAEPDPVSQHGPPGHHPGGSWSCPSANPSAAAGCDSWGAAERAASTMKGRYQTAYFSRFSHSPGS